MSWRKEDQKDVLAAYADVLDYYMYPEDSEDYDFGEVGGGLTEGAGLCRDMTWDTCSEGRSQRGGGCVWCRSQGRCMGEVAASRGCWEGGVASDGEEDSSEDYDFEFESYNDYGCSSKDQSYCLSLPQCMWQHHCHQYNDAGGYCSPRRCCRDGSCSDICRM